MNESSIKWFCNPQGTIEEAQNIYDHGLFNPAAIFEMPDGKFAMGYIREQDWPPHKTAQEIERITGYKMVSCCDPVFGIWKPYQAVNV